MNLLVESLLGFAFVVLQVALVYVLAPPRILVGARLVPRADRETAKATNERLVRLTLQSMEPRDDIGGFRVELEALGGTFERETEPAPGAGRCFVGTSADLARIRVSGDDRTRRIEVDRFRPMKSWVFELPVSSTTSAVKVKVSGSRRNIGKIIPVFRESLLDVKPKTEFAFEQVAEWGKAGRNGPEFVEPYGNLRVPAIVLSSVAAVYGLLVNRFGPPLHDIYWEALPPVVLLLAVAALYYLTRPEHPVVAQGYREAKPIKVEPKKDDDKKPEKPEKDTSAKG